MFETSHVLITGAAGLIGASVARVLVEAGVRVTGMDDLSAGRKERLAPLMGSAHADLFRFAEGDVRDRDLLLRTVLDRSMGPVTSVLHLAGRVGVRRVLQDPVACEEENLELGRSVAAVIRHARGQGRTLRAVAASTSEVYAESDEPLSEASSLRPLVAEGRWRYAASKRAAEEVLDRVVKDAVHLRFFNVVGPGQDG
jgi:nucleoside-diphosphate-sugar epimerase